MAYQGPIETKPDVEWLLQSVFPSASFTSIGYELQVFQPN